MAEIIFGFTVVTPPTPYLAFQPSPNFDKWSLKHFIALSDSNLDMWSRTVEPNDVEAKIMEMYEKEESLKEELAIMKKMYQGAVEELAEVC
jgi:hypothetical protein